MNREEKLAKEVMLLLKKQKKIDKRLCEINKILFKDTDYGISFLAEETIITNNIDEIFVDNEMDIINFVERLNSGNYE